MKHGKKPTAEQRKIITSAGYDWRKWLVVINLSDVLVIQRRASRETRVIEMKK